MKKFTSERTLLKHGGSHFFADSRTFVAGIRLMALRFDDTFSSRIIFAWNFETAQCPRLWDMDEYRELFLEARRELVQDFAHEVALSDKELIAKYRPLFQSGYPPSPKRGVKSDFYALTDSDGFFGYTFQEAFYIRIHLCELLLGDLWGVLCDLDEEFGTNFRQDFPYAGQARRSLAEIERDPPRSRL